MNISYRWLKDFTDYDYTPAQLRDLITSRVATVDEVIDLRQDLKGIIVGRVVEAKPHSNSDHLWVTKVDAGGDSLYDVVCGAQNIVVGTLYPFAPVGTTLPGGVLMERRKIRGEISNGMLCSVRDLNLGSDHAGILALDVNAAPGTPFLSVLPAVDARIVVDVLANRADLLSHEGVAREIAAATGRALRRPGIENTEFGPEPVFANGFDGHTAGIPVCVNDLSGCPLYCATIIRGVTVGPSPHWLIERLDAIGVRSISNVVDVTNYMLYGFGQPMHTFDLNKLSGPAIVVRKARDGETITTLDGVTRTLSNMMTVIADAASTQAIAGVIGGQGSEVDTSTTDILLEVAAFDPRTIRATRRSLKLSTGASYRFERALDLQACGALARYAAALIVSIAGGNVDGTPIVLGEVPKTPKPVALRPSRVTALLGNPISAQQCTQLLQGVGFVVEAVQDDVLQVLPPSWRSDVTFEVDLIEDIARLQGFDTFSDELRSFRPGTVQDAPAYTVTKRVASVLTGAGLYEARPLPFVPDAGEQGVRVLNPLAENEGMLRTSLLETLGRRVEYNFAHMVRNIRLFDIGVAFKWSDTGRPIEKTHAAVVISGDRFPSHFTDNKPSQVDLWDAKYIAEQIGYAAFGAGSTTLQPKEDGDGWDILVNGQTLGTVGTIMVDSPVWASPVYGIEIDITDAFTGQIPHSTYRALPITPSTEFDIALIVPDEVSAEQVERVIRSAAGDLLEAIVPFDEFRIAGTDSGARSVAWRLTLRHPERTLREKEIEGRRAKILQTLDQDLRVRQRTS